MPNTFTPVLTTLLSESAITIAKGRHYPYKTEQASQLWGLALQQHSVPVAYAWGHRDVPAEVRSQLATRITHRERSGQVIDYAGRQYFVAFHHTAEHCALIADCCRRQETYLSLIRPNFLLLPDRRV